jgi:hypothetical protein
MRTILVVLVALGCGKGGGAADAKNKRCAEAVADGKVAEARGWLADDAHVGFEVGKAEMRELVEAFYAQGARSVRAAYDDIEDTQVSALLVVDLPTDKAARAAVFAKYSAIREQFELDTESDVGQTCVLVGLD